MAGVMKRPSGSAMKKPSMQKPSSEVVEEALPIEPPSKRPKMPVPDNFFSKEFLIRHIAEIIGFYESRVVDPSGGLYQSFYRDGSRFKEDFRQIVSSARMVINFMLAGKLLERPELTRIGQHGLRYLEQVHLLPAPDDERYAFTVVKHQPCDLTQQAYALAFVLAAHAAALSAKAVDDGSSIARLFDLLERKFFLPEHGCYRDTISAEGIPDDAYRGQNSNMHLCEALIAAYEATQEARYLDRAETLAETFTQTLAAKAGGFVYEHYTADFEVDWEYNKNDPTNIYRPWGFQPGHQSEWAKNLLNIHRHRPKAWMVKKAQELFDGAWTLAYDGLHGGLVYGFGPDKVWCDAEKYFWVQAESMATAALLYEATKEPKYVERYLTLWHYCWEHWVDHEHGAWRCFKMTRENVPFGNEKTLAGGKCDYHTLVACVEALRAFAS